MSDSNRDLREGPHGPLTDEELDLLERANERDQLFGAGAVNTRRLIAEVRYRRREPMEHRAVKIVNAIASDIITLAGVGSAWEQIDRETLREIRQEWTAKVRDILAASR